MCLWPRNQVGASRGYWATTHTAWAILGSSSFVFGRESLILDRASNYRGRFKEKYNRTSVSTRMCSFAGVQMLPKSTLTSLVHFVRVRPERCARGPSPVRHARSNRPFNGAGFAIPGGARLDSRTLHDLMRPKRCVERQGSTEESRMAV
jgi:hypothetical protein